MYGLPTSSYRGVVPERQSRSERGMDSNSTKSVTEREMAEDKKDLTEEEMKKAAGARITPTRVQGADRRRPVPGADTGLSQRLDPLGDHREATPEQRDEADPTQQP